jgi:uroporphyrinogen decarboxylase
MDVGKSLLAVLNGQKPERRPIWLMRQAGRYLPEYRAVRERAGSFLKLCYNPELAAEVTLQPLKRYDFDAAIVFSDILVVPHAMGANLDFVEGEGPVLSTVRSSADLAKLGKTENLAILGHTHDTLKLVKAGLGERQALIGFCGAPWTVASYLVEGGTSDRAKALAAAREAPEWFAQLIDRLVEVSAEYLIGQARAGAEALQIFDSWAGDLPAEQRKRWCYEPIRKLVSRVRQGAPGVPVIVFARGIGTDHGAVAAETLPNGVSVEQGISLSDVLAGLPEGVAVQGNLTPELLLSGEDEIVRGIEDVLRGVPMSRHVFNLGHGILQQTPPERVSLLVETVRRHDGT